LILFELFGWRELLGEFGKKRSAAKYINFRVNLGKMSFKFDPLENIDRSEDDNDPKTLKALEVKEDSWKSPRRTPSWNRQ
jgi:hypothetical protein